jgi:pimeloyl-ACP methyl ester carboxylesterase
MKMRVLTNLALLVSVVPAAASAQAVDPTFVYGRDYTFEKVVATREVDDAEDKGTIQLMTYVYRPLRNDRREVVLFSHGSTGGLSRSPKEPAGANALPAPVVQFFVSRGYTLVAPMRRGRGESTGSYIEECSVFTGQCTVAEQVALGERGIREALLDTDAVVQQLVLGRMVPVDSRILLVGHSRGGFLSLILAGERPALVKGVVNFAGGWYGVTDRLAPAENQRRMDDHKARLARAAGRATAPTLWFYAARDALYRDGVAQELNRYWQDAGGRSAFVFIGQHTLPNGHLALTELGLWEQAADDFLKKLAPATP